MGRIEGTFNRLRPIALLQSFGDVPVMFWDQAEFEFGWVRNCSIDDRSLVEIRPYHFTEFDGGVGPNFDRIVVGRSRRHVR